MKPARKNLEKPLRTSDPTSLLPADADRYFAALRSKDTFRGNDRFEVRGYLGAGAFGEVFRVFDRTMQSLVALKTLQRAEPAAIYRFKEEFRVLADVIHPNLVQLYELQAEDERWFFTMELVDGVDFAEHVRGPLRGRRDDPALSPDGPASPPPDLDRLLSAMRQLALGLCALHRAGKLHCDVKPSNLRVTPEGRVVLLDFGLVRELVDRDYQTAEGEAAGTPAYMSPEAAGGNEVTAASDWYSAGVVLYEALTGCRPFTGTLLDVLRAKVLRDAASPRQICPDLPEDLSRLCCELLDRDPGKRPSGLEVLARLGGGVIAPIDGGLDASIETPFVGREAHLAALGEAFEASHGGKTAVVFVHGSSGIGKSALVARFLERIRREHPATVVLEGRCYDQESMPYKGLDALIDTLSRYLRHLPSADAQALIPDNVLALTRLFPALRRVRPVAEVPAEVLEIPDPREQKRQARAALRELLRRVALRSPLVLSIDDLQWGDTDSADLLAALLDPPDPPSLMLICCYRSEEADRIPLLCELLSLELDPDCVEARELAVEALSPREARELGLRLLGERSTRARDLAGAMAEESQGSPFFLVQLVRAAQAGLGSGGEQPASGQVERPARPESPSVDRLVAQRVAALSDGARRLLEAIAVAGQPIEFQAVARAAKLDAEPHAAVRQLRLGSFVRAVGHGDPLLETYHDRIRETVVAGLEPSAKAALHGRLARELESTGRADLETLTLHYLQAGERERASELAVPAAEQAEQALAFDRAVRLYRIALDLEAGEGAQRQRLRIKLADALGNAMRGPEAADAYLAAAENADGLEALELGRRAGDWQLVSGNFDDCLATIGALLDAVGIRLPRSKSGALVSLLFRRSVLALRGWRFRERDASQIPDAELFRLDLFWSAAGAFGAPTIRGMDLITRHLHMALEAGDVYRIARAMALEVAYFRRRRTTELRRTAMTLARRSNHPHAIGLVAVWSGIVDYNVGRWRRALEQFEHAASILRGAGAGIWFFESYFALAGQLYALSFLGEFRELFRRLPVMLSDARDKGMAFLATTIRDTVSWTARLASDRPKDTLRRIDEASERKELRPDYQQYQAFIQLTGRVEIALYLGDGLGAWRRVEGSWSRVTRPLVIRLFPLHRTYGLDVRCRAALAAMANLGSPKSRGLLRRIRKDLHRLERGRPGWGRPLARVVRAGVEALRCRTDQALEHLTAAEAVFESYEMALHAAVCRQRRGLLIGGAQGRSLVEGAAQWMTGQGIVNPERMADLVAPGLWPPRPAPEAEPALGDDREKR